MERPAYPLYKGLQRPLVFKYFRGRFIYWALGSAVAGILAGGLMSALVGALAGLITLVGVSVPLLLYTVHRQREGLYRKRRDRYVCVQAPRCQPARHAPRQKSL
jgi:hypothetical protein